MRILTLAILVIAAAVVFWLRASSSPSQPAEPRPHVEANATATLGGGCFWCLEAIFDEITGVASVTSGYSGGSVESPTYEQVCTGTTGHAEVVQVRFDSTLVSFGDLLRIFFTIHDPTTLNRQGPDKGTQYRSAILFHDLDQKRVAQEVMGEIGLQRIWDDPIVTEVAPLSIFYPAEEYHQKYFARNPDNAYCAAVIAPKVLKFREEYSARLRRTVGER